MEPRLYVETDLGAGGAVALGPEQAGYLTRVLRLAPGAAVRVFNGRHGEWRARLERADKRGAQLVLLAPLRAQMRGADVELLFSPLKRQATDWLAEKATELGAAALRPVILQRTTAETVRTDRLQAIAREAAEQCERLDVPMVGAPARLAALLDGWDPERVLLFAEERGEAAAALDVLASLRGAPKLAVLIGPEGGFAPAERSRLRAAAFVRPISLGPRILRAETAGVAALALVQAAWGDRAALPEA